MRETTFRVMVIVAALTMWLAGNAGRAAEETKVDSTGAPDAEKLGWRLGCQTWTFNRFTFFEAIDKNAALGLKVIEGFPGQRISKDIKEKLGPGMSKEAVETVKDKLKAKNVKLVNFGVTGVSGKEEGARKLFEWANTMGIETIVTESNPDFLDKLCNEYNINIAFHNHPNSWPPDKVLGACEGKSKRMGACADTGHWMRRNLNPLENVKKLKGRIISFHFKDLNDFGGGHDVPWGTGKGGAKAVLVEMHKQGFKGVFSIEYEHKFTMEDLAKCVKYFNDCAKEIAAGSK